MSDTGTAATVVEAARRDEDQQMRALLAIHGGLTDDLLPGVEPFLDDEAIPTMPWPHGWVAG